MSGKQPLIGSSTNLVVNKVTFGAGESAIDLKGSCSELTSQPTLFDGNYGSLSNKPSLFDGSYSSLSNQPDLSDYATTTQLSAKAGQGDPTTCVTEQVTGTDPIYAYGTSNIDNGGLAHIVFAGTFTRLGMTHVEDTPLFNINVPDEYTVNVQLRVTAGGVNERGMYWFFLKTIYTEAGQQHRAWYALSRLLFRLVVLPRRYNCI